jgi:hypothetical protein
MSLNLSEIHNACNNNTCVYVYGSDYALVLNTIVTACLLFITIYIIYKESMRGKP